MKDYPEVKELLEKLINKGCALTGYDDGDGILIDTNDLDTIVETVLGVDECIVDITHGDDHASLYFVLGNEAGVALNDYSWSGNLDEIIEEVSNEIYEKYCG